MAAAGRYANTLLLTIDERWTDDGAETIMVKSVYITKPFFILLFSILLDQHEPQICKCKHFYSRVSPAAIIWLRSAGFRIYSATDVEIAVADQYTNGDSIL